MNEQWLDSKLRYGLLRSAAILLLCTNWGLLRADPVTGTQTLYRYSSEPGDYIGHGRDNGYTPENATIGLQGTAEFLRVSVRTATEFWVINLAAPLGEALRPGIYIHAERADARTGRSPGLDVWGDSRGCNQIWGNFRINQIATDESGQVVLLDAAFVQSCERKTAPVLKGIVKFEAKPLSFAYSSDPGDFVGGGAARAYKGATSLFFIDGTNDSLRYRVSGKRDYWSAGISAPTGQRLQVGTYNTSRFRDLVNAGLDVDGNARGCNQSTGTLTISSITLDAEDRVIGLNASFEQHCEGRLPALHGEIHFYE